MSLQKSNPPTILVEATGQVGTPGWKSIDLVPMEEQLSDDGILDLEFVGTPPAPGSIVPQVVRDVVGDFVITSDVERIVGVVVHARTNTMTQLLGQATNPGGPSVGASAFQAAVGLQDFPAQQFTTFALGEEDQRFTTFAIGEEGQPPTTLALGEEGPVKTFAIGEEGPFKSWVFGEEGPKTLALGEDGPKTLMLGEDGPKSLAVGEDGTLEGGETPPLSFRIETLVAKPPQADMVFQPVDRFPPGPDPRLTPFGQR